MVGKNGGLLRRGNPGNKGGGRPKDAIRAKLRDIAYGRGISFLKEIMRGKIAVQFVGICPKCRGETKEDELDPLYWAKLQQLVEASVDHRLKATEQALRYGVGTQTEAVSREEIDSQAQAMLGVLVDRLLGEGWAPAKIQALCEAMTATLNQKEGER